MLSAVLVLVIILVAVLIVILVIVLIAVLVSVLAIILISVLVIHFFILQDYFGGFLRLNSISRKSGFILRFE